MPTGTESPKTGSDLLDCRETYATQDPTGLRDRIRGFAAQCETAWTQAQAAPLPPDWTDFDRVIIGGMGGSAIAGDLVADLAALQRAVPILVVRDFQLPYTLDRRTLFIGCSYSGGTSETRSLFQEARQSEARLLTITSGGPLAEEAGRHNIPCLMVQAPGEPRSALGYNIMLLLQTLDRLGLVRTSEAEARSAIAALRSQADQLADDVPTRDNQAKQLALALRDRLVVVYGGGSFIGVARRWKTQLNENGKVWAFYEPVPELLHNSVEAFGLPSRQSDQTMVLLLQPDNGSAVLKGRFEIARELLRASGISHQLLPGTSGPPLTQLLSMVLLGDYVSYYLGLLQGINPSDTGAINQGKDLTNEYN